MSQWFGGQGRKGGKPTPEDPSGLSRGRAGRPVRPDSANSANRPPRENFNQNPAANWDPNRSQPAQQPTRPGSRPPQANNPAPQGNRAAAVPPQWGQQPSGGQRQGYSQPPVEPVPSYQQPAQINYQNQYQETYDNNAQEQGEYEDEYSEEPELPQRIEFKKRLVALIFDFLACYIAACVVSLIPLLNAYLSTNVVLSLFLLVRDFMFEGRGIGKNLMGLQVVDANSGAPASLKQAALRNIVLVGPYLLTQVAGMLLHFIPWTGFNTVVTNILDVVGAIYVIIVIPMEVYRAYNRPDGQRLGDQIAHTEVIESAMDFSRPLPRR